MRFFCLLALLFMVSLPSFADFGAQTELETKIQQKIIAIIHPVDSRAMVLVNLRFKKVEMDLPGTGSSLNEMFSPETSTQVTDQEIEKITIQVISNLKPFPQSLRSAIENSLGIGRTKLSFSFQEMDPELKKVTTTLTTPATDQRVWVEPMFREFMDTVTATGRALKFLMQVFMVSLIAFLTIGFFLSSNRFKKQRALWESSVARLTDGLLSGGTREPNVIPTQALMKDVSPRQLNAPNEMSRSQMGELSPTALKALISDCYWCEQDDYAAWIWGQLSAQQRESLLRDWPMALDYSSHLSRFSPEMQNDHMHSCYLKPFDLSMASQKDLENWVRRYPEAWSLLSPMRQRTLKITLQEKMRLSSQKRPSKLPVLPVTTVLERNLGSSVEVGQLSDADELSILADPDFIPFEVRPQVFSLVWLALLPLAQRTSVLESLPAQSLSEAWIGAPEVLAKVKEAIPEKKRKLIEGYTKVVTPSRLSMTMKYLTQTSIDLMSQGTQGATDGASQVA